MNVRALVGRKRATRPGEGRPRKLSQDQEARLLAWHAAKRPPLTAIAAELGIGVTTAKTYIQRNGQ